MLPDDAGAVLALAGRTLPPPAGTADPRALRAGTLARLEHPCRTDPGGCLVAERADGSLGGAAQAIVREGLWGLSLLAVDEDLRGRGVGRELLERCLAHGAGPADGPGLILSSEHPAAMRRYARAGFSLHPALAVAGIPVLDAAPTAAADVADAGAAGLAAANAIGRAVRGAGYGEDLAVWLDHGARLLVVEDRAFTCAREGRVLLVAGRDEPAAALALWAAILSAPRGATISADFLTAGQQWAIRVALDARLALSPEGPVCTRGMAAPPAPYLPSGAWL
jgi:GNAT superfamily N-acetyltransferase